MIFCAAHLPILMIDHNVVRFHIPVHNTLAVAKVKRFEELVDVVAHVIVAKLGIESAEVGVVDILEDQGRSLTLPRTVGGQLTDSKEAVGRERNRPGNRGPRQEARLRWGHQPSSEGF